MNIKMVMQALAEAKLCAKRNISQVELCVTMNLCGTLLTLLYIDFLFALANDKTKKPRQKRGFT